MQKVNFGAVDSFGKKEKTPFFRFDRWGFGKEKYKRYKNDSIGLLKKRWKKWKTMWENPLFFTNAVENPVEKVKS